MSLHPRVFLFKIKYVGTGTSLVAQSVKNPPVIQETWVWSLGWDDSSGEGDGWWATVHGVTRNTTELLNHHHHHLGSKSAKIPAHPGMRLKMKDLPNNKNMLDEERERISSLMCRTLLKSVNCSPGDADVIHDTVDQFRNAVYPDLALCLIVLKTNARRSSQRAALCSYILKLNAAVICFVRLLYRRNF